jgi:hypothetical protein
VHDAIEKEALQQKITVDSKSPTFSAPFVLECVDESGEPSASTCRKGAIGMDAARLGDSGWYRACHAETL